MEIVQRLSELVKLKAKSKRAFAAIIGIEQVTFNNYMIGKRGMSYEVIDAILRAFPEVSAEWLLRGEGDMLRTSGINTGDVQNVYETLVTDKDEQIEELKAEVNRLLGENNVMREQLGMSQRKGGRVRNH